MLVTSRCHRNASAANPATGPKPPSREPRPGTVSYSVENGQGNYVCPRNDDALERPGRQEKSAVLQVLSDIDGGIDGIVMECCGKCPSK